MQFLGHIVGNEKLDVTEYRVTPSRTFCRPDRKKELKSFLGGIGYYRQFIEGFASFQPN